MSLMWSVAANICGLKILNSELSEHFFLYGCSSIIFSYSKALLKSITYVYRLRHCNLLMNTDERIKLNFH